MWLFNPLIILNKNYVKSLYYIHVSNNIFIFWHIRLCPVTCSSSGFSLPISCSRAGRRAAFCWISCRITWNWGWFLRKFSGLPTSMSHTAQAKNWKKKDTKTRGKKKKKKERATGRRTKKNIFSLKLQNNIRPFTSPSTWWRPSIGRSTSIACRYSWSSARWRRRCITTWCITLISAWDTLWGNWWHTPVCLLWHSYWIYNTLLKISLLLLWGGIP